MKDTVQSGWMGIGNQARANRAILVLAVVLTAGIFMWDLNTPLGWAYSFLYLIPLTLLLFRSSQHPRLVGFATLCSGLIILGWAFSPEGGTVGQVAYNRCLSIVLLWITALFLRHRGHLEAALHLSREQLEGLVEERTAQFQKVIGLLTSEITERELAQAALRESQERFRLLIDHANDAIFYIDLDGAIQWFSCHAGALTGQPRDKLAGRPIMELLSSSAAAVAEARLAAVRRGEAVPPLAEFEFLCSDGSTVFAEASIASVRRDGEVVGRLIVARDITERKRGEEARARLAAIVESSEDAIISETLDGDILTWNKGADRMYGYSAQEIVGRPIAILVPPEQHDVVPNILERIEQGESAINFETARLRKDGKQIAVSLSISPIKDETGKIIGASTIARDITERKRAEEALRESEQQLRLALDERERLSQDLHDNVMQTIYAIGLSLEECLRTAQQSSTLSATKVREAIGELNSVIHDIRSYIIGEEPKISGGIQLAKELSRLIQTTGRGDALGFHLKLDSMVLHRLSPEQANHILYIAREAISNSLRHSRAQTGTLSLWLLGDTVRFEVRDDGVGFTGDMTTSQGHGLRNIAARVDKLGGLLRITSEPGNGVLIVVDILLERKYVAF